MTREEGFTLTEVLVAITLMTMVVFALYSMFDMGLRVFRTGNSTVEANQNARIALDRMEREIRSAWPVDETDSNDCGSPLSTGKLLDSSSNADSIAFWNCASESDSPRHISYQMSGNDLIRTEEEVNSQSLATLNAGETSLKFRYLDETGNNTSFTEEAVLVEITLVARDGDQKQTLMTNAGLRNAN